jgi:hypothetical protein
MSADAGADAGKRRVAIVTGASRGIGADIARVLAGRGVDLALVARNRTELETLANEIAARNCPRPLVVALDLSERDAPEQIATALATAGAIIDMLINNAGFGLAGEVADLDAAEQVNIVDLNIGALVALTLRFLPDLIAARGRILNVASTAAFLPGPGMAVYYATKAFVLSFSEALTYEMRRHGVTVSALCPGPTATAFFARAGVDKFAQFDRFPMMSSLAVAEAGVSGLMQGRRIILPGAMNKLTGWLVPFIPHALLLPAVARLQSKRRQD